jgi:hypothetical protein
MSKSLIIWWMLACFTNQELFAFTISQIYGEEILDEWKVYVSGPYGSRSYKDGDFFTDFHQSLNGRSVEPNHWPDAINLRSGDSIDAIQIFYGNYRGRLHGWEDGGGELHKIRLYDGDKIIRVIGRRGIGPGASIDQLTFHTKKYVLCLYLKCFLFTYGHCLHAVTMYLDHLAGLEVMYSPPSRQSLIATSHGSQEGPTLN